MMIPSDIEHQDQPRATVLAFPCEFAPPAAVSNRELAGIIIENSPAHAQAVSEGRSRRLDLSDPSDAPQTNSVRPEVFRSDCAGSPSSSFSPSALNSLRAVWNIAGEGRWKEPDVSELAYAVATERRVSASLYPKDQR